MPNRLHVIAVCSNPAQFKSRIRLMKDFIKRMEATPNVVLYVVEAAFGRSPHEVTCQANTRHTQLRTTHEIWNKEAMINIGLSRLPNDAKFVAWIDGDVEFVANDWASHTMDALEKYEIVQPWSHAVDLGPHQEIIGTAKAFTAFHQEGVEPGPEAFKYGYWHSGYAWAARRSALNQLSGPLCSGPLLDFAPLGSADFYMAWSLIGRLRDNLYNDVANADHRRKGFQKPYVDALFQWQNRAQALRQNIGNVPGTILHHFHGWKKHRYYNTRENILIRNDFNPHTDIRRDINGLITWVNDCPRQWKIRDQVRRYFSERNEDVLA